jgi:hypothetical protein
MDVSFFASEFVVIGGNPETLKIDFIEKEPVFNEDGKIERIENMHSQRITVTAEGARKLIHAISMTLSSEPYTKKA